MTDVSAQHGIRRRLATWLQRLDAAAPREESFSPRLRGAGVTARIGVWLGGCFAVCLVTGLISHFLQNPLPVPFHWPPTPVWGYRFTQGLHVTSGVAAVPLLAVKLWSVAPKFWARPLFGGLRRGLERLSVLVLVAAGLFQLVTGLLNVAEVYAWRFFFPAMHFAAAFVAVGAILLHVAVKLPVIRSALAGPVPDEPSTPDRAGAMTRRGVLVVAGLGSVLAVVSTVGDKVHLFDRVSIFAQRTGRGPQGRPVNQTAAATRVGPRALDPAWTLEIVGATRTVRLDRRALLALPMVCVEGWSFDADWAGVPLGELLRLVGEHPGRVRVRSLEPSRYGTSDVSAVLAAHPHTLIALAVNGEDLDLDHGFPARLIAPNRPGALQTKWLSRIELLP